MNRIRLLWLTALLLAAQMVNAAVGDIPKFDIPDNYKAGYFPTNVSVADINNDNNPDIAVMNFGSSDISVFINKGDGTFFPKVDYNMGFYLSRVLNISFGDFNGDGAVDMTVATGSFRFFVFMNNGDGTFANPVPHTTVRSYRYFTVADFNNDGLDDVLFRSDYLSVYINDGLGGFTLASDTFLGASTSDIAVTDFNKDGMVDIAYGLYGTSAIYTHMGNGDGTFSAGTSYTTDTISSLASLDVNGDTFQDLVVINNLSKNITTFLNNGDGTLTNSSSVGFVGSLGYITSGDFNQDGASDIAAISQGNVEIYSNVNGSLVHVNTINAASARNLVSADFDKDGIADILTINSGSDVAIMLKGKGNNNFEGFKTITIPDKFIATTNSDFNGDGNLDIATLSDNGQVGIVFNNGDGTYAAPVIYNSDGCAVSFVSWYYNADNAPDLAVASRCSRRIAILVNDGAGGFGAPVFVLSELSSRTGQTITTDDFNNDNRADLAVSNANGTMSVMLNNGDSTFTSTIYDIAAYGYHSWDVKSDDLNGDNMPDLVITPWLGNKVSVFMNNGDGTFGAETAVPTFRPRNVSLADFNNDGFVDLSVVDYWNKVMTILTNAGDGTFTESATYPIVNSGSIIGPVLNSVATDLNNDGSPDLVFSSKDSYRLEVFINDGTGLFHPLGVPTPRTWAFTVGDLNNDGMQDIAVGSYFTGQMTVLMNIPPVTITPLTIATDSVEVSVTDQELELEFDVVFGTKLEPTDVIKVTVDGVVLLETTFAEFKQEDPSEMEYEYEVGSLEAEIDIVDGEFEIENEAMDFSGLNLTDGLDVVITIGNAQGTVQVPVQQQ